VDGTPTNFSSISNSDKAFNIDFAGISRISFSGSSGSLIYAIIIDRSQLSLGEKSIGITSDVTMDLSDSTKITDGIGFLSSTGKLTIEQIDTVNGVVAGSFEAVFNEVKAGQGIPTNLGSVQITNGKFRFSYDVR